MLTFLQVVVSSQAKLFAYSDFARFSKTLNLQIFREKNFLACTKNEDPSDFYKSQQMSVIGLSAKTLRNIALKHEKAFKYFTFQQKSQEIPTPYQPTHYGTVAKKPK